MPQLDWSATINSIRESVPQVQFQNWIQPLELIRSDERTVLLGVPSRFHEQWLKEHFSHHLTQAIKKQTGLNLQLEFEVLVIKENVEAAASIPEPVAPTQPRPMLRVVSDEPPPIEEKIVRPNLPKFPNQFLCFDYNRTALQCAELFTKPENYSLSSVVIVGGVGMGKTHLLSTIGELFLMENPRARIRYTNAEAFTAEMVQSFKTDKNHEFKRKYREETDCLLFDDIQGLSNRKTTQEQLLHIFNEIQTAGGKIAFASSIPLAQLQNFIDPLKSRLLATVAMEIKTPAFEERVEILAGICEENKISLEPQVLRTLADKGQKDVRELIGSLLRVHLQAKLENRTLNCDYLAKEGWIRESQKQSITMDEIVSLVELNFNISRTELVSKSRKSTTVWARQVAMYLARRFTLLPLEAIGSIFGRDHATVIHAYDKVTEIMKEQHQRQYEIEYLIQKIECRSPKREA